MSKIKTLVLALFLSACGPVEQEFNTISVMEGECDENNEIALEYQVIINVTHMNDSERLNVNSWEELEGALYIDSCKEQVRVTYLK